MVKPIQVGHSMGGNVVLELIPASIVLIDSVILPPLPHQLFSMRCNRW
jgi:hypothetical protein